MIKAHREGVLNAATTGVTNARVEATSGLCKVELIHPNGPWRSLEEVEFATLDGVDSFNRRRLLEPIGNIPPAEFEALYYAREVYYAREESPATAVGLN